MKRKLLFLITFALIFALAACSGGQVKTASARSAVSIIYDMAEEEISLSVTEITLIIFRDDSITVDGPGTVVDGSKIAITRAGVYEIRGVLRDGQIVVKSEDVGTVYLVLNGVDITCSNSAPVYINKADNTVIMLAEGKENYITDGDSYLLADSTSDEPDAAIFSKDDLTLKGKGSLTVNASYNNGIQCKDDVNISGGDIIVNAKNDAIKGRDSITVKGGRLTLTAGGDGMQSNNDEDPAEGYISIIAGDINITSVEDGIQAETVMLISGGDIHISSGGGSASSNNANARDPRANWNNIAVAGDEVSSKGLKAGTDITITGGTIDIDACDDAIHSDGTLTIDGGEIVLSTGDDGIRADSTLVINGGDISIDKSYEGMESATITINNGEIHIVSNDDGINVGAGEEAGGPMGGQQQDMRGQPMQWQGSDNRTPGPNMNMGDASGGFTMPGQPGADMAAGGDSDTASASYLYINGGYLVVNAAGDGLDINGSAAMNGGTVIVNGPTSNGNGALDYYGTFQISGGFLVAAGSAGMAQAPSTSSTQHSIIINLPSLQEADTIFHIESENGKELLTFMPAKAYQSVVISSSEIENGLTYDVYCGGSSTGLANDGLYNGGSYSGGSKMTSITVSDMVTSAGSARGGADIGRGGFAPPGGRSR